MKYKVGDEVLVKCKILGTYDNERYGVTNSSNLNSGTGFKKRIYPSEKDIYPVSMLQDATAEEAWEIAKKFNSLSGNALIEIFNTDDIPYILQNLTIWQIKGKIEGWEQNKIEVGDFVEFEDRIFCVTGFIENCFCGIDENGLAYSANKKDVKKTGRHIDIDKILEQIGSDE